jgi:carbon-monoxide dehydrogenase medium subunit
MFPSQFDYVAAASVEEAVEAKASGGDDCRFLAGGQSLLPMMKTRLASPAKLIDINRIPGLDQMVRDNGHIRVGALVRHADVVASDLSFGAVASAAPWISDPLVRNMGTLCGSVAHCDPEGDWNSVLLATGADVIAHGSDGERAIPIDEFIVGIFTNALRPDEMVTEVRVPVPAGRSGGAYLKLERRIGDYATVAVAAHLQGGTRADLGRTDQHQGHRGRTGAGRRDTERGPLRASGRAGGCRVVAHRRCPRHLGVEATGGPHLRAPCAGDRG